VDWVKLSARYYLDPAVAGFDDATEVMFTRAIAYAGDQETHGYVPAGILPALCRRRRYETCAEALVSGGLWLPVRGGYQITRWEEWQAELEAIVARRSADRDRKRRERERARAAEGTRHVTHADVEGPGSSQVNGMSRDMSRDVSGPYRERERDITPPHPSGASPPRKRGRRIPDDFQVTPDMVAWAREHVPHVDGRAETERFTDYWRAKPGRDACKLDWPATWRNWMRRAAEQQAPRGRHSRQAEIEALFDRAMVRAQAREAAHDTDRDRGPDEIRPRALPPPGH
jgi:hypothetical protein